MSSLILNCGTMRPYFPRVENGVTCDLFETNEGLVLVDTGMGINDYLHPKPLMRFFLAAMRSERDINETALYQIQRLGYKPSDIKHIVMTHLHFDHAGGLPDFPNANITFTNRSMTISMVKHIQDGNTTHHFGHIIPNG